LRLVVEPAKLTAAAFFQLRDAVRFATHDCDHQSDLPGLLAKLRLFREHQSLKIQRRVFYEDFVASLRGLEAVRGFEAGLHDYISAVALSDDPIELEDASVLVNYAFGAMARGLLDVNPQDIDCWRKSVLERLQALLRDSHNSSGRQCSLLHTQGFLHLLDWIEDPTDEAGANKALHPAKSISIWRRMIKEVRHAPMFPLERFGKLLAQLAGQVEDTPDFTQLQEATDKVLSQRFGKQKLAEQAFERAQSYYRNGKTLEAIDALHMAHVESFTKETATDSVQYSIFLARMYSEVGLFFASKCYALAAAFAALKLEDDSLRRISYRGFTEAASSDHATGASMEFFLTARLFFFVTQEYSMSGREETRQFEWARIDFYSLILTRAASFIDPSLYAYLKDTVLRQFGLDEIYDESSARIDAFFGTLGLQGIVERTAAENISPPYSDAGPRRRVAWEQLGIRWLIDWSNEFKSAQSAESFCATLQILLTDLRKTELSILPSDVFLSIDVHTKDLEIEDISDNYKIALNIRLPDSTSPSANDDKRTRLVSAVACAVLDIVSAMPQAEFTQVYEDRLKTGLNLKLMPYAEYERLFQEFYNEADFNEHYSHSIGLSWEPPETVTQTNIGLSIPPGLHPDYNRSSSEHLIRRRYKLCGLQVKYTLPNLLLDRTFIAAITELRREGWKDWHILQGIASLRLNYIINTQMRGEHDIEKLSSASKSIFEREETLSDPSIPRELFTVERLKEALRFTQLSTLKGLGFECGQRTPNFEGVDRLLRRFNYWIDDVPHAVIFPE
jgi:hypothetical protein